MLETLAGPLPVSQSLGVALAALCRGLQADEAALVIRPPGGQVQARAAARPVARPTGEASTHLVAIAGGVLPLPPRSHITLHPAGRDPCRLRTVPVPAPG